MTRDEQPINHEAEAITGELQKYLNGEDLKSEPDNNLRNNIIRGRRAAAHDRIEEVEARRTRDKALDALKSTTLVVPSRPEIESDLRISETRIANAATLRAHHAGTVIGYTNATYAIATFEARLRETGPVDVLHVLRNVLKPPSK